MTPRSEQDVGRREHAGVAVAVQIGTTGHCGGPETGDQPTERQVGDPGKGRQEHGRIKGQRTER